VRNADFEPFSETMSRVGAYYDRKLTAEVIGVYWTGLRDMALDDVRGALNRHVQDPQAGQFMPKIADIRRQIEAVRPSDGHPGGDEAWSIAIKARSEGATVVWTEQIESAFHVAAAPLLEEGDKIAARKAFLDRYEVELQAARVAGKAARWSVSLGHDITGREHPLTQAVALSRLPAAHVAALIPHSEIATEVAALLAAPTQAMRLPGA